MIFWILYLVFLFVSVAALYTWALNFFYRQFFDRKKRR